MRIGQLYDWKARTAPARRSIEISERGAAIRVEEFVLTDEEEKGLSVNTRLSEIKAPEKQLDEVA